MKTAVNFVTAVGIVGLYVAITEFLGAGVQNGPTMVRHIIGTLAVGWLCFRAADRITSEIVK